MQSHLEQFRYYAASAGKTPQEVQEIEKTIIASANTLGISVEEVAYTALCVFQIDPLSSLRKSSSEMLAILEKMKEG